MNSWTPLGGSDSPGSGDRTRLGWPARRPGWAALRQVWYPRNDYMAFLVSALACSSLFAASVGEPGRVCRIEVAEKGTDWPVPLV